MHFQTKAYHTAIQGQQVNGPRGAKLCEGQVKEHGTGAGEQGECEYGRVVVNHDAIFYEVILLRKS